MNATLPNTAISNAPEELLTLAQIEARYPDEWVLIDAPELDDDLEIVQGRVLAHSPNRDLVDCEARLLRPKSSAFLFTGEIPEPEYILVNL